MRKSYVKTSMDQRYAYIHIYTAAVGGGGGGITARDLDTTLALELNIIPTATGPTLAAVLQPGDVLANKGLRNTGSATIVVPLYCHRPPPHFVAPHIPFGKRHTRCCSRKTTSSPSGGAPWTLSCLSQLAWRHRCTCVSSSPSPLPLTKCCRGQACTSLMADKTRKVANLYSLDARGIGRPKAINNKWIGADLFLN